MVERVMIIEEIQAIVDEHHDLPLLLLVGFDGVLAGYEADPRGVRLSQDHCDLLRALAREPGVEVGIVSGRRVADLQSRVPLGDDVLYVGLHGLELEGPVARNIENWMRDAISHRIHEIVTAIGPSLSSRGGVRVEDKQVAVAVHTRGARSDDAAWARGRVLRAATDVVNRKQLRVIHGNDVVELVPNIPNSRATAVIRIRQYLQQRERKPVFTLYVGEDVPDDDALRAIEGQGISVAVGSVARHAQYHLRSPEEVWSLIERITLARIERSWLDHLHARTRSGHSNMC
jgi:trehalose 6-phosphate phosphatase